MKIKFRSFIEKNDLIGFKDKILLAVSGGVDSMVMLQLFHECGYSFSVAHCNFSLRGQESDEDEELVRGYCRELRLELYAKRFDTLEYAHESNLSIQVAARELRYSWFRQLCNEYGFASVAIAHNRNDIAETMLINLCRGTGLKGLTGIKPKTDNIIRPLLYATRKEIEAYANEKNVNYRDDSSNAEVKYARNRIRHNVIPELEKINTGVIDNFYSTSVYLSQAWDAIEKKLINLKEKTIKILDNEIHFSIPELLNEPLRQLFLVEELIDYGFSPAQVIDIEKSLFTQSGKLFFSDEYRLIRDRDYLIVTPRKQNVAAVFEIDKTCKEIDHPIALSFDQKKIDGDFNIPSSLDIGVFDLEKIIFPVILRRWNQGDWFIPLGMKGKKKISDFLIDNKVPLHKKESIYVMVSGIDIIWVLGYRIDNRFKITEKTKKVWIASLK